MTSTSSTRLWERNRSALIERGGFSVPVAADGFASCRGQGDLVKVKLGFDIPRKVVGGGPRGCVDSFSRGSRKRLMEMFNSFDRELVGRTTVFITLTYGQSFPGWEQAKQHLEAFVKRLVRRGTPISGVWRIEDQARGAPHFHLIVFNVPKWKDGRGKNGERFLSKNAVARMWGECVGDGYWDWSKGVPCFPHSRIEGMQNWRRVMYYTSKYCAKGESQSTAPAAPGEGDEVAPPGAAGAVGAVGSPIAHNAPRVGRRWGVFNRAHLPFASIRESISKLGPWFGEFARRCHMAYRGVRQSGNAGFTLFRQDVDAWCDLFSRMSWIEGCSISADEAAAYAEY